ncbi:transposase [Singulisphaera sp. GP187]|uniref:transposase n=1 Tax=Singulisphaera sp. GP187 TaxID=1882752 RepID=UPI0039657D9E
MPTHVHVLVTRFQGNTLSQVLHSWKSYTGKVANRLLGQTGRFWQEEYFDRRIRDETHFWIAKRYIEENPVKAGLCHRPEDWMFGSAARQR